MSDKAKNTISNIVGMIALVASFVALFVYDIELMKFGAGFIASGILFYFKSHESVTYLKKFLNKKTDA